jgi:hypothetical protein
MADGTTAKHPNLGHRVPADCILSDDEDDQDLSDANSEPDVIDVEALGKELNEESEGDDKVGNDDAGSGDEDAPEDETNEQELGM